MNRPPKSSSTACTKIEAYCDFLESKVAVSELEKSSLAKKIEDLSMELVNVKLKLNNIKLEQPCNNLTYFIGTCSHCRTELCHYCGKCTNPKCVLFSCDKGENPL